MKSLIIVFCALLFTHYSLALSVHEDLKRLAAEGNGLIRLNPTNFEMLTSQKRTWSASIHFTALDPQRRCHPCKQFDPNYRAVAKAWSRVPASQRDQHFFAILDFDDAPSVFQQLGLVSAPLVYTYPPATGERKPADGRISPTKYDFIDGFDAAPLAQVISKLTPTPIPYKDPIDWSRWTVTAIGLLSVALLMRFVSPIVQNKWFWAATTVLISLVMTSGFMYVRIRNAPYTGGNGQWIAAGYTNQFGQEVHVIAFIYGLLAFSILMLTMVIPYQLSPQRQRIQIYLWLGVIMIMYSILISLFRIKNRGYPFKLFL